MLAIIDVFLSRSVGLNGRVESDSDGVKVGYVLECLGGIVGIARFLTYSDNLVSLTTHDDLERDGDVGNTDLRTVVNYSCSKYLNFLVESSFIYDSAVRLVLDTVLIVTEGVYEVEILGGKNGEVRSVVDVMSRLCGDEA